MRRQRKPQLPRQRHLSAEQRYALEALAAAGRRGCTGATLFGHGSSVDMLADLVHDGLVTAHRQTMRMGRRKIQFARMMITDPAGGRSKADQARPRNAPL